MTTIHIRITVPTITGVNVGAKGRLRWTPTLRRNVDPNTVVLPKGFDVDLVSGEARVNVAPTSANWCWKVEEGLYRVGVPNGTTRYVSVPDSETVINYIDLPDLDPATLEPTAAPAAVWDVELSQVDERVTTLENAPTAHTHDNLEALNAVEGINTGDQDLSGFALNTTTINNKPLSSDITLNAEDVGSVDAGSLSQVATTGDYNDLSNRPTFKIVVNRSGVTIPANTLVEMHGAFGILSTVRIADNTTADNVSGIAVADILDGDEGEIQVSGTVEALDTSSIPDGSPLYLGTAGSFTATRPAAPAHIIRVGVVGVVHPVAGSCVFTLPAFEILADNVDGLDTKVTELAQDETAALGSSLKSTYVAQANLTVTPGASVSGSNTGDEPDASETVKGIVELATTAEATTGTDTTRAVTPAGVAAAIAGVGGGVVDHGALSGLADDDHTQYALADGSRGAFAATSHTHTASQISDSTATGRTLMTAATANAARAAISAAPALGSDDNYVTAAEKLALHSHSNKTALDAVSGVNTGDQDLSGYALSTQTINAQTGTTYELVASDASKLVTCTNSGAITVTIPASTFTAGQRVDVAVLGDGMVTLVGSGITLNPEAGLSLVSRAQYSAFTIYFLTATTAFVTGSMAAA